MKTLDLNAMQYIQGEGCLRKSIGCTIASGTMGIINPLLGLITGFVCSQYAQVSDCDIFKEERGREGSFKEPLH